MQTVWCDSTKHKKRIHSLHVQFYQLNGRVFNIVLADPDLQVVSCGLGEGLAEPRRAVELAA